MGYAWLAQLAPLLLNRTGGSASSILGNFTGPATGAPSGGSFPGGSTAGGGGMLAGLIAPLASIAQLISGPGAGQTRRAGARAAVEKSQGLSSLRARVLRSVPIGAGAAAAERDLVITSSPSERAALLAVVNEATSLGGFGKAQGERGNFLGDVIKYTLTGETTGPKRYIPTLGDLQSWLGRTPDGAPPGATPMYNAQPVGSPAIVRGGYWAGFAYRPRF